MILTEEKKEKHGILLRLSEKTYNILKKYKELTGLPITSQINEAIISWCFLKKLINIEEIRKDNNGSD